MLMQEEQAHWIRADWRTKEIGAGRGRLHQVGGVVTAKGTGNFVRTGGECVEVVD